MILTELYKLSHKSQAEGTAMPSMYNKVKVRWLIPIDVDGKLKGAFIDLKGATKAEQRGKEYIVPDLVRAAGIKPKLLTDNGEYVLGTVQGGRKCEESGRSA